MGAASQLLVKLPLPAQARSDLAGGLVSAAVAAPLAMGYGMFAFVALGSEYFVEGAFAGLLTAALVGIACVALGDKSAHVYAPRVTTTFFIGLLLYNLLHSDAAALRSGGMGIVLAVIFAIMLLAGLFQALFGLARLGTVIKLIPQPVMSGFQNAAALILFLVQIGNVFGFDDNPSFLRALTNAAHALPLSVLVAAVAAGAMWQSRRLLPKVPPLLVGLAAGTLLYYACRFAGLGAHLGATIGAVPLGSAKLPHVPQFVDLAHTPGLVALLPTIVGGALALAIVASIDALLCTKLLARPGDPKIDGDRLLVRLGAANALTAGLGGITAGLNMGPSRDNREFGGRTPVSVAVNAAALVLLLVVFPIVSELPRAALSGVIMVIAIQHVDPWTVQLARRVASRSASRSMTLDLVVIGIVAVLSLAVDIVLAVLLGLAMAALLFVVRMSRSVIRRLHRCGAMRSRKARAREEMQALAQSGAAILAIELQGALFFGSAERLAAEIAAQLREPTRSVILDLRRVTQVDSNGARILLEINSDLALAGKHLLLSVAQPAAEVARQLTESGVVAALGAGQVFPDLDRALEWAEDDLLASQAAAASPGSEVPFFETSVVAQLNAAEIALVEKHVERLVYEPGRVVFREGDPANEFFIVARGTASAFLRPAGGADIRLITFSPGTVFGELAFLDAGPRSATVTADSELVCYVLSAKELAALAPAIAIKLLTNLGRQLGVRLRDANRTIQSLEA